MKRSDRLRTVCSIAEHEERVSSKQFGAAQQALDEATRKLRELDAYRRDYRNSSGIKSGASASAWQEHNRFLQRLDQAVAAQEAVVRDGEASREAHRLQWIAKRKRLESLARAVDKYEQAEQLAEERREQRALDDTARRSAPYAESEN